MRLVRNIAIYIAATTVCLIAMLLAAVLTLITNTIALVITPVWIAVYAAVFAWTGDENLSWQWEMGMRRVQVVFALPSSTVIAVASITNDKLWTKLR